MDAKPVNNVEEGLALMTICFSKLQTILEDKHPDQVHHFTPDEYMRMYTSVHDLCLNTRDGDGNASQFYDAYCAGLAAYHSGAVITSLRRHGGSDDPVGLLAELNQRWLNHTVIVRWLSRLLSYLKRSYLSRVMRPGLADAGAACFREGVYDGLDGAATAAMLALLWRDREGTGDAAARDTARGAVGVLVGMGGPDGDLFVYRTDYEAKVVEATAEYYSRKSACWLEDCDSPEYMARAEEALRREKDRAKDFLHRSSEPEVAAAVREAVLVSPSARLFEDERSGFRALVRADRIEDVKRIFRLYADIPAQLGHTGKLFREHVVDEGMAIVRGGSETGVVEKLIELHNRYSVGYVGGCFNNHTVFQAAVTAAFEAVAKEGVGRRPTAELLVAFCDDVLKKGGLGERMSDEAVDDSLESVVQLLSYVDDKDVFVEFYRKKLSHRLLFGRSASEDCERSMTTKLKCSFGFSYTMKLESMLNDMAIAKENDEGFRASPQKLRDVDFSVVVLTTNRWPSYKSGGLTVPAEMARCIEAYNEFYAKKFRERRLSFVYSLGSCNLQGKFASKTIELNVATYQCALLLLFNHNDTLTYYEIAAELNMDGEDLTRVLHSLSCDKYKILKKTPGDGTVTESDVFEFNLEFDDPMRRIKIALPPLAAEQERKKVGTDMENSRAYNIDAGIVRIKKGRKVLSYQKLIIECVELLKPNFKPDVMMIKKRIENLIEREYLERDEQDPNIFKYLA